MMPTRLDLASQHARKCLPFGAKGHMQSNNLPCARDPSHQDGQQTSKESVGHQASSYGVEGHLRWTP